MKLIIKNPFTVWFVRFIKSKRLEYRNKEKKLKIGYMSSAINCIFGKYNTIYDNVTLNEVNLGDFTYIAAKTIISKTTIGKFCSIGSNCQIGLGRHPSQTFVSTHPVFFSTLKQAQITFSDKDYFEEFKEITIGNDVWLGANVIIVDGVKIGDGVIVAAGSVVTKDIPAYAIVGGVPAKIIKYRFKKEEIEKLLAFMWWDMDIDELKKDYKKFHNIEGFFDEL